jgi:hypothetical protein
VKLLRRFWHRLRGTVTGARRDDEFADEIESHLQMQTEDNLRLGMTPEAARRAAALKFGSVESARGSWRDQPSSAAPRHNPGRRAICGAWLDEGTEFQRCLRIDTRSRDRSQQRDLQCGERCPRTAAPLSGCESARASMGNKPASQSMGRLGLAPGLRRLAS